VLALLPVVFLLLARVPQAAPPKADLLIENGVVYAAADAKPRKASILVGEGRILFVGEAGRARRLADEARRVDLAGAFVYAGWADAHLHLAGLGKSLEVAKLRGLPDAGAAAAAMQAAAANLPPGAWVEGRGWDQNLWPGREFPDARALDRVLPDRPAVARRVDGHAVWVNTAALRAAGIDAATKGPAGGRILRRSDGAPSGVLVDNAMDLLESALPAATPADTERWLLAGAQACARVGLTEVQDASGYGAETLAVLDRLAAAGRLPIRVYATVSPEASELPASFAKGPRIGGGPDFLTVRAIKAVADGALGSRGAALLADYADEPGKRGLVVTSLPRLTEIATEARKKGWQLWVHAIGDRGNRLALDAFEAAVAAVPSAPTGGTRPRIEHAQILALEEFPRFASLSVIASIQPVHATSDMAWAGARVGASRIAGAYAWRRLKTADARLAGGSDAPVESENPLLGFYAAVTRQDLDGMPAGGWRPGEKLSPAEALALFTSDAAYAAFEEDWRGRIAPGYAADLTIFSRDPLAVPASEIPVIRASMTIVGGRVVHGGPGRPEGSAP
jgi:predicted amidohydrolase YtcJ